MSHAKTSLRADQHALRDRMRALGLSHRQIAVEFARRYAPSTVSRLMSVGPGRSGPLHELAAGMSAGIPLARSGGTPR